MNLLPASSGFPSSQAATAPHSHISHTHSTQSTHAHTTPPAFQGGPRRRSPVTLPGTRQVVGAERARECQPTAKGSLPVGTQLTGALPQCRAQCTHEDNRPTHMLVLMYL